MQGRILLDKMDVQMAGVEKLSGLYFLYFSHFFGGVRSMTSA